MELRTIGIDLGKPVFHLPLFLPGKTVHLSMGNAQGLPLVVYADPLATMSPVRGHPSLSGAEHIAPCKVQETVPELLFSAPVSTWFEKQSCDSPQKTEALSRFVNLRLVEVVVF
jgi:hypothetical protein